MKTRQRSATTVIDAEPEQIFALLADPAKHPLLDGSGSVLRSHSRNPERLSLGATFRWRWQLKPLADGKTEVTETFDWLTARVPFLIDISFFPRRNQRAIEQPLDRLPGLVR